MSFRPSQAFQGVRKDTPLGTGDGLRVAAEVPLNAPLDFAQATCRSRMQWFNGLVNMITSLWGDDRCACAAVGRNVCPASHAFLLVCIDIYTYICIYICTHVVMPGLFSYIVHTDSQYCVFQV